MTANGHDCCAIHSGTKMRRLGRHSPRHLELFAYASTGLVLLLFLCRPASGALPQYPISPAFIAELRQRAMSGDALSQFMLGEAYEEGADGFAVNTKIAAKWYRKAADQRDARAQAALGRLYEFGDGVPANHQLALDWVRRATAEAPGSAMAIVVRYEQEKPPNEAKATEWLLISADAGDVRAQNRLGELYDTADAGG